MILLYFLLKRDIEEFKILGEKGYKKCVKDNTQGEIAKDLNDMLNNANVRLDWKDICKRNIAELKNITSAAEPQSYSNSTTTPITYLTHYDYTNGFSVEYPSD
jgi:hypothetical protein